MGSCNLNSKCYYDKETGELTFNPKKIIKNCLSKYKNSNEVSINIEQINQDSINIEQIN